MRVTNRVPCGLTTAVNYTRAAVRRRWARLLLYTRSLTLSIVNTRLLIIRSPESGDNNNAARRRLYVRAVRFVLACPRTAIAQDRRINILFVFYSVLQGAMTSDGAMRGCVFVLNREGTGFDIRSMWSKKR